MVIERNGPLDPLPKVISKQLLMLDHPVKKSMRAFEYVRVDSLPPGLHKDAPQFLEEDVPLHPPKKPRTAPTRPSSPLDPSIVKMIKESEKKKLKPTGDRSRILLGMVEAEADREEEWGEARTPEYVEPPPRSALYAGEGYRHPRDPPSRDSQLIPRIDVSRTPQNAPRNPPPIHPIVQPAPLPLPDEDEDDWDNMSEGKPQSYGSF
jgi:hypothetical protein